MHKKTNVGGRPPYEPTEADRNTVKTMAACGITHDEIARCLGTNGIAAKTLRRHFRLELKTALTQVSLTIPLLDGQLALGTWQGIYLFEHRNHAHRRSVVLHLIGE